MMLKLSTHKLLWFLNALMVLAVSFIGVLKPEIYNGLVERKYLPGTISQDLTAWAAAILVLALIPKLKEKDAVKQIVLLGINGFFFYAYGIYAIERVYNWAYFVYMAIFGLSFYAVIYGVVCIRKEFLSAVRVPDRIRKTSMWFALLIPIMFYPLWTAQLIPLIREGRKIETIYSIYILDLCFIMPLFIMIFRMMARKEGLGVVMAPSLFILSFTLLFPVGFGEFLKPFYDLKVDPAGAALFLSLSGFFLILGLWILKHLRTGESHLIQDGLNQ